MAFDFNTAAEQHDVIPNGTIVVVQVNIRPGDAGEDGLLKRSQSGEAEMLACELIVVEGAYAKRKFLGNYVLSGTTDGHAQAADRTRSMLRAILESVRGFKPTDMSEAAKKARVAESYRDFDGIRFLAKLGVEPAKDGYRAKNTLDTVITPDMKDWHRIEQVEQPPAHATPAAVTPTSKTIVKPAWAKPVQ
jgi:hypothetical protein